MPQEALQSRVFEFSGDVCAPPVKGLNPLERSYDVYERYVEASIKLKDQMLYGKYFFILVFITEYIFRYVFFLQNVLGKACTRRKLILQ